MKFECQKSCGGKCCSMGWDKKSDFVFLTKRDRQKISKYLNVKVTDFAFKGEFLFTRFTKKISRQWALNNLTGTCQFLENGRCGIYEVRPTQCKTFPFWPELMFKGAYMALKEFCPGIGKGKRANNDLLEEQIKADRELCNQLK